MSDKKISFRSMMPWELEFYAEEGYQRAQYIFGKQKAEGYSPENLAEADKWLTLAMNNDGIDPGTNHVRPDKTTYAKKAKDELGWVLSHRADWRVLSGRSNKRGIDTERLEFVNRALDIEFDYVEISMAEALLLGDIDAIGRETKSPEEHKAHALALLVKNIANGNNIARKFLKHFIEETPDLDVMRAYGEGLVKYSINSLIKSSSHHTDQGTLDKGFQYIEQSGHMVKHGYDAYNASKKVMNTLQGIIDDSTTTLEKDFKQALKKQNGDLSDYFIKQAQKDVLWMKNYVQPRATQARSIIQYVKETAVDFE